MVEERSHLEGEQIIKKYLKSHPLKIKEVAYILQQITSILISEINNH
jgi:hypothetical protein